MLSPRESPCIRRGNGNGPRPLRTLHIPGARAALGRTREAGSEKPLAAQSARTSSCKCRRRRACQQERADHMEPARQPLHASHTNPIKALSLRSQVNRTYAELAAHYVVPPFCQRGRRERGTRRKSSRLSSSTGDGLSGSCASALLQPCRGQCGDRQPVDSPKRGAAIRRPSATPRICSKGRSPGEEGLAGRDL
jgi:hypothetical protein